MQFNHPGWRLTGRPYLREVLLAEIDDYRRSIVIKKSSAVGWTEVACITAMQIAQGMKKQKRRRPVLRFRRTALAAAIENLSEGEPVWIL